MSKLNLKMVGYGKVLIYTSQRVGVNCQTSQPSTVPAHIYPNQNPIYAEICRHGPLAVKIQNLGECCSQFCSSRAPYFVLPWLQEKPPLALYQGVVLI